MKNVFKCTKNKTFWNSLLKKGDRPWYEGKKPINQFSERILHILCKSFNKTEKYLFLKNL